MKMKNIKVEKDVIGYYVPAGVKSKEINYLVHWFLDQWKEGEGYGYYVGYADEFIKSDPNSVHRGESLPKGGHGLRISDGCICTRVVTDPGWWEWHWKPTKEFLSSKELESVVNAGRRAFSESVRKDLKQPAHEGRVWVSTYSAERAGRRAMALKFCEIMSGR